MEWGAKREVTIYYQEADSFRDPPEDSILWNNRNNTFGRGRGG
jgi:hypothetical protein